MDNIQEEMRRLEKYLSPSPTPFFKKEVPLIEDKEDEFIINIKDEFPFIVTREIWDISSVKTEDDYEQTKFGFNTKKD